MSHVLSNEDGYDEEIKMAWIETSILYENN
jgi:hypothetical protein